MHCTCIGNKNFTPSCVVYTGFSEYTVTTTETCLIHAIQFLSLTAAVNPISDDVLYNSEHSGRNFEGTVVVCVGASIHLPSSQP